MTFKKRNLFILLAILALALTSCDYKFISLSQPSIIQAVGIYQVNFSVYSNDTLGGSTGTGHFTAYMPIGWNITNGGTCVWEGGSSNSTYATLGTAPNSTNANNYCGEKSGYQYVTFITTTNPPRNGTVNCTGYINATTEGTYNIDYYVSNTWNGNNPIFYTDSSCNNSITILAANTAPSIDTVIPRSPITIHAPTSQAFTITASDPENDSLNYQWYIDGNDQAGETGTTYDYSVVLGDAGSYNVSVSVTDGEFIVSQDWAVTVTEGYQATYESGDVDDIIIDGVGKGIESWIGFAFFIALILTASVLGIIGRIKKWGKS